MVESCRLCGLRLQELSNEEVRNQRATAPGASVLSVATVYELQVTHYNSESNGLQLTSKTVCSVTDVRFPVRAATTGHGHTCFTVTWHPPFALPKTLITLNPKPSMPGSSAVSFAHTPSVAMS